MNKSLSLTALVLCLCSLVHATDVIQPYQGRIVQNSVNYDGTGYAYFVILEDSFGSVLWRSDDNIPVPPATSPQLNLPGTPLTVDDGAFTVALGDTGLTNMDVLPASVFSSASSLGGNLKLRIYFSADNVTYELLTPDVSFYPAPYATVAETALSADTLNNPITESDIADGAVTSAKIALNSIESDDLVQDLTLNTLSFNAGAETFGFSGIGQAGFSLTSGLTTEGPIFINTPEGVANKMSFILPNLNSGEIQFLSTGQFLVSEPWRVSDWLSAKDFISLNSDSIDPYFEIQGARITYDKTDTRLEVNSTFAFEEGVVIGGSGDDANDAIFFGFNSDETLKMEAGDFVLSDSLNLEGSLTVGSNLSGGSIFFGSTETGILTYFESSTNKFIANDNMDVQGNFDVTGSIEAGNITGSVLRSDGNIYVNDNGPDGFSSVYFWEGSSRFGAYLQWDDPSDEFNISHPVTAPDFRSTDDLFVRYNQADGDGYVYFREAGSNTSKFFRWDDSENSFDLNDSIEVIGTVTEVSDRRLKRNIVPSEYGIETVLALQPVTYQWNPETMDESGEKTMLGLIAQDVVEVVPEVVKLPSSPEDYYGLDYDALVPVLIKAIQQQQAQIEALQAEVNDLRDF